jgi:hypothetical protein
LNTLPDPPTCGGSLLVLGLVLRHLHLSFQLPRGGWYEEQAPDALYPINFVVKHPNLVVLSRRPALRRWETCRASLERLNGLFPDRRHQKMAAIGKQ